MTKKRKPLTSSPIACAVSWCVAVCAAESTHCAVHRISASVHPEPLDDDEAFVFVPLIGNHARPPAPGRVCSSCNGTGECESCEGSGEHECGHFNCSDTHECGNCGGNGECPDCDGPGVSDIFTPQKGWSKPKQQRLLAAEWTVDRGWAINYLRAIYLPPSVPLA